MEGHREIDVLVATHKNVDYELPEYCRFIQVGSANHEKIIGYLHDDSDLTGHGTISEKNDSYCELTALYFLWKQSTAQVKGLYQYRRLFYNGKALKSNNCRIRVRAKNAVKYVLDESKIMSYLNNNDVIVEIPYFPGTTTVRTDLEKYCYKNDIDKLGDIIRKFFPEYYETYQSVLKGSHASYLNMLIAKSNLFDSYCEWLFAVLNKCEEVIDISNYDKAHKRIYGYFGEILMNVYLRYHNFKEKYVPVMYIFEYMDRGRLPIWASWVKESFIQLCGRIGIALPTRNEPAMEIYNQRRKIN